MFERLLNPQTLLALVPALPLAAAVLTAALGPRVLGRRSHLPVIVALALAAAASTAILLHLHRDAGAHAADAGGPHAATAAAPRCDVTLWTWADVAGAHGGEDRPSFRIDVSLHADPLAAVMLVTVTLISLLVAVYSAGYMHGDSGYWRYFSYIGLFVFSMTMLVTAANFLLLYVFWEAVGLCSYLLIGFWYEKPEAAAAGKKAFLVNRVGDFGFALGIFLIWLVYGTLNFYDAAETPGVLGQAQFVVGGTATAIALLLLLGACGKSAQFPLHVWLPDAMEGPTPVSALIHAATMVTAGVYMVARCMPLFVASPTAGYVVAIVGAFTALLAALVALTQFDLKRILAYSTISQLGFMFLAMGTGTLLGAASGMFHLVTHAFFKALLFLGAGSVMHAMGNVIDLRRFGGLRRRLPITHATFLVGCLALAGVWPFAGFWSKDAILVAVRQAAEHSPLFGVLYVAALGTALLTAFYTFRAFFLAFYGPERLPEEAGHHAHESPPSMTVPLMLLALGSLGVGAALELTHSFEPFLARTPSLECAATGAVEPSAEDRTQVALIASGASAAGIALAWLLYVAARAQAERLAALMRRLGLYQLSYRKFYLDEIYALLVVRPLELLAALWAWGDRAVVDGLVDAIGAVPGVVGRCLRPLQGGLIPIYAVALILGLLLMLMGAMLI